MKKKIAVICAISAASVMFTGCGRLDNTGTVSDTNTTTISAVTTTDQNTTNGVVGDVVSDAGNVVSDVVTVA